MRRHFNVLLIPHWKQNIQLMTALFFVLICRQMRSLHICSAYRTKIRHLSSQFYNGGLTSIKHVYFDCLRFLINITCRFGTFEIVFTRNCFLLIIRDVNKHKDLFNTRLCNGWCEDLSRFLSYSISNSFWRRNSVKTFCTIIFCLVGSHSP